MTRARVRAPARHRHPQTVVAPSGEHAAAASDPYLKLFKYSVASDDTDGQVELHGVCEREAGLGIA